MHRLALACLLLAGPAAYAQDTAPADSLRQALEELNELVVSEADSTVDVVAWYQPGETKTVEYTKTRIRDGVTNSSTSRYTIDVLEETAAGYTLRWSPQDGSAEIGEMLSEAGLADTTLAPVLENAAAFEFTYYTDDVGTYLALANRDSVVQVLQGVTEAVMSAMLDSLAGDERAAVESMVGSLMTPDRIVQSFTEPIQLFHLVIGYVYPLGEPWDYEDLLPSPFGGGYLESTGAALVTVSDGLIEYDRTTSVEPEDLRETMLAMVDQMASSMPPERVEEARAAFAAIQMRLEDRLNVVIDAETGWTQSLEFRRTVEAEEDGEQKMQVDLKTLRLVE
ncbi:MAG: hypothetical protein AAGI08_09535 [Bacteroidota bacterium]